MGADLGNRLAYVVGMLTFHTWLVTILAGVIHAEVADEVAPFGWPVALVVVVVGRALGALTVPDYDEVFP
jgi:hypothetical protein